MTAHHRDGVAGRLGFAALWGLERGEAEPTRDTVAMVGGHSAAGAVLEGRWRVKAVETRQSSHRRRREHPVPRERLVHVHHVGPILLELERRGPPRAEH